MPKSHSSSLRSWKALKSSSWPKTTMPALLTSTSMRPWHSTASATMARTWSIFVRSAVCELTVAPSSRSLAAQSCTASAMSQMARSAPSSASTFAVAKPMLSCFATPVTRATLPSTLPLRAMLSRSLGLVCTRRAVRR